MFHEVKSIFKIMCLTERILVNIVEMYVPLHY